MTPSNPSLHHLVEDHFRPKWWQFFRKQKYHVCQTYGGHNIFEVPSKCIAHGKLHDARRCAKIVNDKVEPQCGDSCPPINASDPGFFNKLDEYLARGCYAEESVKDYDKNKPGIAGASGVSGVSGFMGTIKYI